FAYSREREFPLSGGVSVVRKSIPLDERLAAYTTALLRRIAWHGVAMGEFTYDRATDRYTLMEINGRFQASTALSLDAGINLPRLVAALYGIGEPGPTPSYRVGIEERWLRGDLLALRDGLGGVKRRLTTGPAGAPPSRARVLGQFLRDFRPGIRMSRAVRPNRSHRVCRWTASMTTIRSAHCTKGAVMSWERCAERSTPRPAAAARASRAAGRPGPRNPADSTCTRGPATRRRAAAANGLRKMLPLHTTSTRAGARRARSAARAAPR